MQGKKYLPENLGIKQMLTQPYVIDTNKYSYKGYQMWNAEDRYN